MSLETLLTTPISESIHLTSLITHLTSAPFHQVPGTFNLRSTAYPPLVKSNLIYRSGLLSHLSDEGKKILADRLGIKTIFDLRFTEETEIDAEPVIDGVESIATGVEEKDVEGEVEGMKWANLADMYLFILRTHEAIFRKIFLHILHHPEKPFLIHCTAGKDRTGVAIALILALAGVPQEAIVHDYTLTRIGIEPVRELLQVKLMGGDGEEVDWEDRGTRMLAGCGAETMVSFLDDVRRRNEGGVEGYVQGLGLTTEDIEGIRKGLKGIPRE